MARTAIIPAAGKGTRMGSPEFGKELLVDHRTHKPLIDFAIETAKLASCQRILVLVKKGTKRALQEYLMYAHGGGSVQVIELDDTGNEWPDTLLNASEHWDEMDNLLLLPDTRYNQGEVIAVLDKHVYDNNEVTFGLFKVDPSEANKFGIVNVDSFAEATAEKPTELLSSGVNYAWGTIAFTADAGKKLFAGYSQRGEWLSLNPGFTGWSMLSWFKDITRNGVVESW